MDELAEDRCPELDPVPHLAPGVGLDPAFEAVDADAAQHDEDGEELLEDG